MTISNYDLSVVSLRHTLTNLQTIARKSEAHADAKRIAHDALLQSRLFPDMLNFISQVRIATDIAKGGVARLSGSEPPSWEDDESSFADVHARIQKALDYLNEFTAEQFEDADTRDIALKLRDQTHEMSGQNYLLHFVLPNVYFHVATAYGLMRHNGVELGKRDFIGSFTP